MQEEGLKEEEPREARVAGNRPTSRSDTKSISLATKASLAEVGYTLLALFSFAAALYALWLAGSSAGLTAACVLGGGPVSAPAGPRESQVAWAPAILACLAAAGLIWVCFRMLSKSSTLATGRRLVALTHELAIPDVVKLEVMLANAGTEFQRSPTFEVRPQDDEAVRAAAAGKWVLERFGEGSSVVAVPESLAASERLRAAVGAIEDRPIQVLRNDRATRRTETAP